MGNLGDAFKKAGLISDQELGRISRPEGGRHRRGRRGGRGGGSDSKGAGSTREGSSRRRRKGNATFAHLDEHALGRAAEGMRPFHYVAHDGAVPAVAVNEETAGKLESGELAIAAAEDRSWIIPAAIAAEMVQTQPELVRFFRRPEAEPAQASPKTQTVDSSDQPRAAESEPAPDAPLPDQA